MFCVVDQETVAPLPRFRLFSRQRSKGWHAALRERPRYTALTLEFPLGASEELCRKRAAAGLAAMADLGCSGAVLPRNFPFPELPGSFGIAVSTPVPLYRRLAGRVCLWAADSLGLAKKGLTIALYGRRMTEEMLRAAAVLGHRAQSFIVDAGADTEALCEGLRRYYGISPLRDTLRPAGIYILFDMPDRVLRVPDNALVLNFSGRNPAIEGGRMADGVHLEPPRSLWAGWPQGCDSQAFLAALVAGAALRGEDLHIRGLCRSGELLIP